MLCYFHKLLFGILTKLFSVTHHLRADREQMDIVLKTEIKDVFAGLNKRRETEREQKKKQIEHRLCLICTCSEE